MASNLSSAEPFGQSTEEDDPMTSKIAAITLSLSLAFAGSAALAQGHIAGAAVGAAAGAHSKHAVAGAVVGGAIGHHMAKTHQKKMAKKAAKAK